MKHKKIIVLLVCLIFFVIVACFFINTISFSNYSEVLEANWGLSLPADAQCSEIYDKNSEQGFTGDGWRYHVFTYKEAEPISKMFNWQTEGQKTKHYSSYSETVNEWLNEIEVPLDERPNFKECVYWYQSEVHNGIIFDEIIFLWDNNQNKLYVAESLL